MTNIIRADLYAILRGKILYVTLAVMLAMNIFAVATMPEIQIDIGEVDTGAAFFTQNPDGIGIIEIFMENMENFVFFLLPLLIAAAAPIFTHNTVKNDLAWGVSRVKLYFTKLLVAIGLCIFALLFYMSSAVLVATVLNGFGGPVPDGFFGNLFLTLGAQLYMLIAVTCIGVFLVFATKRTGAVIGIYIAFCLVPVLLISILLDAGFDVMRFFDFDMLSGLVRLGNIDQLDQRTLFTILGMGTFYIITTTLGGIALFKRAEIK